jgi:hypothetical protein
MINNAICVVQQPMMQTTDAEARTIKLPSASPSSPSSSSNQHAAASFHCRHLNQCPVAVDRSSIELNRRERLVSLLAAELKHAARTGASSYCDRYNHRYVAQLSLYTTHGTYVRYCWVCSVPAASASSSTFDSFIVVTDDITTALYSSLSSSASPPPRPPP